MASTIAWTGQTHTATSLIQLVFHHFNCAERLKYGRPFTDDHILR